MDLSKVKWVVIVCAVFFLGWLITDPGINFMIEKYSVDAADAATAERNEAGLTRVGGLLMRTLRVAKAREVFTFAVKKYPNGKNYWYNMYRLVKCAEKAKDYPEAVAILRELIMNEAWLHDSRVPGYDNLTLRMDKLKETHNLGEVGHW